MADVWETTRLVTGPRPAQVPRWLVRAVPALLAVLLALGVGLTWWSWPRDGDAAALGSALRSGDARAVQPGAVQHLGPWWRVRSQPLSDTLVWQDRRLQTHRVTRSPHLDRTLRLPRRLPADDDYVFGRLIELRGPGVHGSSPWLAIAGAALVLMTTRGRRARSSSSASGPRYGPT